jgi:hypothetical protein
MAFLVIVHLAASYIFVGQFRSVSQAKVFEWQCIAIWTVAGLAGIWFSARTGFPEMMDPRISQTNRFLYPALIGIGFGALAVWVDRSTGWATALASRMELESIHIPYPASVLMYTGGSIVVEVLYRLLPVPFLVWLASNVLLRGRWQSQVFWITALVVSAVEPVSQHSSWEGHQMVMNEVMVQDYAMNLSQCYLFRRYGFLAPLTVRVAFYGVWHVLWGYLQQSGLAG